MSTIETLVDVLQQVINPNPLHERLVTWGWVTPSGSPLTWEYWQARASWPVDTGSGVSYLSPGKANPR
jgi:hypothetical protein